MLGTMNDMSESIHPSNANIHSFIHSHRSEHIATTDWVSFSEIARSELPLFGGVKNRDINTTGDKAIVCMDCDIGQWTLNTIKNSVHDTRSEFNGQRLFLADHGIADSQTGCIFKINK